MAEIAGEPHESRVICAGWYGRGGGGGHALGQVKEMRVQRAAGVELVGTILRLNCYGPQRFADG